MGRKNRLKKRQGKRQNRIRSRSCTPLCAVQATAMSACWLMDLAQKEHATGKTLYVQPVAVTTAVRRTLVKRGYQVKNASGNSITIECPTSGLRAGPAPNNNNNDNNNNNNDNNNDNNNNDNNNDNNNNNTTPATRPTNNTAE